MKSERIDIVIREETKNIAILSSLTDKQLAKKLDLIHIQMELAEKKGNANSLELLEVWRSQVIAARIYKSENNIPDAPDEIKVAIA